MRRRPPIQMARTDDSPAGLSATTAVVCASAVFIGAVLWLARSSWPIVLYRMIVDGGVVAAWLLASAGFGAAILRMGRVPSESRLLSCATATALGLGLISLATLGLGLAGWLNRLTALALLAAGLVAGAVAIKPMIRSTRIVIPKLEPRHWAWVILAVPAAIAIVGALVPPGILWGDEPHGYDVLEYHLQVPREWYELGRIVPLEHNVFSYFPFNVEMHYLLAMHVMGGPWEGMYVAQLMHVAFMGVMVVALAGMASPLVAILVASVPWIPMLSAVAYNEGGLLLYSTLAIGWTLRTELPRHALLAGALAGLACGAKLTAVPMLLLAVPFALMITVRSRDALKNGGLFLVAGMLSFSPWLIRNAFWSGNPVFPEAASVFGSAHLSSIQVERWKRAHSPTQAQRASLARAREFAAQVLADWRYGYLLLPLGVLALVLRGTPRAEFLAILLVVLLALWLGLTHLQGRFFVLSIPIAAILVARVDWRGVAGAAVFCAGLSLLILGRRIADVSPALGAQDLQSLLPQNVADALDQTDRPIVLAGDAQAFLYQVPMKRLHYRTVFDVDVLPGRSAVDAWTAKAPPGAVIIVSPSELRRFARTYWSIPAFEGDQSAPYVIPPAMP